MVKLPPPAENLLSEAEVRGLTRGLPQSPGPDLVEFLPGNAVRLTAKGRQLYRLAMLLYGASPDPVDEIVDVEGLQKVVARHRRILDISAEHVEAIQRTGKVPEQGRELAEAARSGELTRLHEAWERRLLADEAGPNVIPVNFRRKQVANG